MTTIADIRNAVVIIAIVLLVALGLGTWLGYTIGKAGLDKLVAESRTAAAEANARADRVSLELATKQVETVERVRTVFKDRVVYRDREVPVEVRVQEDAACVVPDRFVRLWNGANRAAVPGAPGEPGTRTDRSIEVPAPGGREALDARGAARAGSRSDAPEHRAVARPD